MNAGNCMTQRAAEESAEQKVAWETKHLSCPKVELFWYCCNLLLETPAVPINLTRLQDLGGGGKG